MERINEIAIGSYRGISNLKLSGLTQINILTGDNNCGKTSILEVIESFSQPENIYMWNTLTRRSSVLPNRSGMTFYEGIYDLFNINSDEKRIEYSLKCESDILRLEASANEFGEEISEEMYRDLSGMYVPDEVSQALKHQTREVCKMQFDVKFNGKRIVREDIYEMQRYTSRELVRRKKGYKYVENIIYISPIRHATGDVFLSDVLDNPELYEEMLGILREYDENIISINYDNENGHFAGQGVYKILSKSHKKALPLNVYGDGMKKAILLMSAVVKAKNGILLLDEFETAIHTSAMEKTFRWILQTCKKLNVQVFMTSHSKEAIDKVLKCSPDLLGDITVYTIYKDEEEVTVRRLDAAKAIEVHDEMGLELR